MVERELHRLGVEGRAAVELDVLAQLERVRRRVRGRLPAGREAGVERAGAMAGQVPDERVEDAVADRADRDQTARRRVERVWLLKDRHRHGGIGVSRRGVAPGRTGLQQRQQGTATERGPAEGEGGLQEPAS